MQHCKEFAVVSMSQGIPHIAHRFFVLYLCMVKTTLQCMMLSMSEQGHPHIAHHVFVEMYVWNVRSVLAVVSKSAQNANHSPQLRLKPCMFDIPLQCSTARNLLLSASLPRFLSIDYKCF